MTYNQIVIISYVSYIALLSLIAFCLFLKDKKMAKKNGDSVRIKEKTLLSITSLGGGIGAFFGRIVAHHKTNKMYFTLTIYLSIIFELAVLGILAALAINM